MIAALCRFVLRLPGDNRQLWSLRKPVSATQLRWELEPWLARRIAGAKGVILEQQREKRALSCAPAQRPRSLLKQRFLLSFSLSQLRGQKQPSRQSPISSVRQNAILSWQECFCERPSWSCIGPRRRPAVCGLRTARQASSLISISSSQMRAGNPCTCSCSLTKASCELSRPSSAGAGYEQLKLEIKEHITQEFQKIESIMRSHVQKAEEDRQGVASVHAEVVKVRLTTELVLSQTQASAP